MMPWDPGSNPASDDRDLIYLIRYQTKRFRTWETSLFETNEAKRNWKIEAERGRNEVQKSEVQKIKAWRVTSGLASHFVR